MAFPLELFSKDIYLEPSASKFLQTVHSTATFFGANCFWLSCKWRIAKKFLLVCLVKELASDDI